MAAKYQTVFKRIPQHDSPPGAADLKTALHLWHGSQAARPISEWTFGNDPDLVAS
jgi:hypothetical protein